MEYTPVNSRANTHGTEAEGSLEKVVRSTKASFVASAFFGFAVGLADRLATGAYNPGAAATATAVLSSPFLLWKGGAGWLGNYLSVNAGLNAGYSAGYAATDAIVRLFSS